MTPAQIRAEVARLREQVAQGETQRRAVADALAKALAVEPNRYRPTDVSEARCELSRVEQKLADLAERMDALTAQLPPAEAVRQAETKAAELTAAMTTARTDFYAARVRYPGLLRQVEAVAREMGVAREAWQVARTKHMDVARAAGLATQVPDPIAVTTEESKLVHLISVLIRQTAADAPGGVAVPRNKPAVATNTN